MAKPVWVDTILFDSVAAAARYLSKKLRGEITSWQVQSAMESHYPIGGMWVRDAKPPRETRRVLLLRYPHGETHLERGLPGVPV